MEVTSKMNKMQLQLLQFFSQKEVSHNEADELQKLISKYYFDKAQSELEKVIKSKKISQKDLDNLASQHLRTLYVKQ